VEDKFRDILSGVTAKPPRARLEPCGELRDGLRRRGPTYRDIAEILAERCQLRVSIKHTLRFSCGRCDSNNKMTAISIIKWPLLDLERLPSVALASSNIQLGQLDGVR
jgi:hypothetical protein